MTDQDFEQNLSDREILVLIAERTRSMKDTLVDHEKRLRTVEDKQNTQTGQFQGAGKLWALLATFPAGVVGFLVAHYNR